MRVKLLLQLYFVSSVPENNKKDTRPIVAIGDLHDDWDNTIKVLLKANLIKPDIECINYIETDTEIESIVCGIFWFGQTWNAIKGFINTNIFKQPIPPSNILDYKCSYGYVWNGNDTILVQTGDIVDRGPYGFIIYQFLQVLKKQSHEKGGDVILLLGNHELMNLRGKLSN